MKQQVLYIHGGTAFSSYGNFIEHLKAKKIWDPRGEGQRFWTSTLREDLGDDFELFTPKMPNAQNAKYDEWRIWFERHLEFLKDNVVLMGWSLGGMFLAKYLAENVLPMKIKAVYLIAAPFQEDDFGGEDGGDFIFDTTKLGNIATQTKNVYIFHSNDDPIVPYEHALAYKNVLPVAELVTFEDKGHFLVEEFPELLAYLKRV